MDSDVPEIEMDKDRRRKEFGYPFALKTGKIGVGNQMEFDVWVVGQVPARIFQVMLADVEAQDPASPRRDPFRDEADPGPEIDDDVLGPDIEETHDPVGMDPAVSANIVDTLLGFQSVCVTNYRDQKLPVRLEAGPG